MTRGQIAKRHRRQKYAKLAVDNYHRRIYILECIADPTNMNRPETEYIWSD
jgi:hypothetical protein